ncbi:MAG: hypothetical protein ACRDJP_12205, partial [Actinomycetota bacterium]
MSDRDQEFGPLRPLRPDERNGSDEIGRLEPLDPDADEGRGRTSPPADTLPIVAPFDEAPPPPAPPPSPSRLRDAVGLAAALAVLLSL